MVEKVGGDGLRKWNACFAFRWEKRWDETCVVWLIDGILTEVLLVLFATARFMNQLFWPLIGFE